MMEPTMGLEASCWGAILGVLRAPLDGVPGRWGPPFMA